MSTQSTVKVPFRGAGGQDKGDLQVPLHRIDERVRYTLLKEAVVMYGANKRRGTHATKTRSYVAGSNKKPWRQKGTGRARAGTRKSPLWRGAGIVFGPHPRDYSYSIHKKQRRLALKSALLSKFVDGEVVVVDGLRVEEPKTKRVHQILEALGVRGSCLIGTKEREKNLVLAARNIPGVRVSSLKDFNALDVINARKLILSLEAFEALCGSVDASEESPAGPGPAGSESGS